MITSNSDTFGIFGIKNPQNSRGCFVVFCLAEGVGEDDQGDHDDGEDNDSYLQVLLEESAELNGPQALFFEDGCTVPMVSMVVVMFLFHILR